MQSCFKIEFWRAAALAAALLVAPALAAPAVAQDPTGVAVGSVEITGNRRVPADQILTTVGMQQGDTVMAAQLDDAMRRLLATGQFRDVQVFAISDPANPAAPVTLRFQVEEQPMVAQIQFLGLENLSASMLRDTVGLRAGRPYEPSRAVRAEAMARQLLAEKGFRVRSIEHRLEPLAAGSDEVSLIFDVEEGQRVAISEIEFVGNQAFSDSRLRDEMSTKREGFWWFRSGTFDDEQLREDMRGALPSFYASNGYIDAAIVGDSLVVDDETGKARLIVRVEEGPQYRLAEFDVVGASRFASDDLRRYFEQRRSGFLSGFGLGTSRDEGTRTGEVFDQGAFEAATDDVRRLYTNQGYLYARINPVIERLPADTSGPRVRVVWDISEGNPASIRRVVIAGNTKTHEDVIRNQLSVLPGDIYSEEMLIASYRRASGLGFFETPMPAPRMEEIGNCVENPSEACQIDVIFEVTEKQTGSINFGTSLGGSLGLMGFLGYDEPNLFGQAKSGHLRWEFGRYSNNFEASYSDPSIRDSFLSGGLSLFSSTDRFFTFNEGRRHRTGASLRLGIPMPTDRFSRLSMGYSLSRTSYENFDDDQQNIFSLPPGVQSTVTLSLDRNALDHPMFPTVGSRQSVEAAFSGGLFGGDGDFQKYSVTGAWYVPVGSLGGSAPGARPVRFTLGLQADAGALFGDASRFPFDRFWMGGVQFGRPLRGYDETTITPSGYIPSNRPGVALDQRFGDAYLRLSAEYAIRFTDNISLGAFYDAGNVWRRPSEVDPTRLLRGAGIGATIVTPFGPLGLDYAYGFDKDQPGWQLHFKFGQGF
ncbi:MAG: outer membrane protein assembly factor BamA [Gemmatimonadetes bacterium]|nr:outer membrane protein assembly factor BamA [Gemmatimonadota bacterium]